MQPCQNNNLTETLQHPFNLTTSSPQLCHNLTTIYLQPPCNLIRTFLLFPQNLFATLLQPCFNPHVTFCTTTSLQPCSNVSAISLHHHHLHQINITKTLTSLQPPYNIVESHHNLTASFPQPQNNLITISL